MSITRAHSRTAAALAAAVAVLSAAALAGCSTKEPAAPAPSSSASESAAPAQHPVPPGSAMTASVYYISSSEDYTSASLYRLSLSDGKAVEVLKMDDYGAAWSSLNVTPDGKQVSYVTGDGQLEMRDISPGAGEPWGVSTDVDGQCAEPVWAPDGTMLYGKGRNENGLPVLYEPALQGGPPDRFIDATTCHYRFSADSAKLVAGAAGNGDITVMNADGSDPENLKLAVPGRQITDLAAVGPGAVRVCVRTADPKAPTGDVARNLFCDTVIDVTTGEVVPLPVKDVKAVRFAPDGSMLVRADGALSKVSADGKVLSTLREPAEYGKYALLEWLP